jgi:hypothetical protein
MDVSFWVSELSMLRTCGAARLGILELVAFVKDDEYNEYGIVNNCRTCGRGLNVLNYFQIYCFHVFEYEHQCLTVFDAV